MIGRTSENVFFFCPQKSSHEGRATSKRTLVGEGLEEDAGLGGADVDGDLVRLDDDEDVVLVDELADLCRARWGGREGEGGEA